MWWSGQLNLIISIIFTSQWKSHLNDLLRVSWWTAEYLFKIGKYSGVVFASSSVNSTTQNQFVRWPDRVHLVQKKEVTYHRIGMGIWLKDGEKNAHEREGKVTICRTRWRYHNMYELREFGRGKNDRTKLSVILIHVETPEIWKSIDSDVRSCRL